jgi:hypothetical protein
MIFHNPFKEYEIPTSVFSDKRKKYKIVAKYNSKFSIIICAEIIQKKGKQFRL